MLVFGWTSVGGTLDEVYIRSLVQTKVEESDSRFQEIDRSTNHSIALVDAWWKAIQYAIVA